MAAASTSQVKFPIIDSHIHLYAAAHLNDLAWAPSLPDGHVLKKQNSVTEYRTATKSHHNLVGFVFVETDRVSGLAEDAWKHVLDEVDFVRRIKAGTPLEGEGHSANDKHLLLGMVPWAPMPANCTEQYLALLGDGKDATPGGSLIKGFRYLLQDKAVGTALRPACVESLLILERKGYKTFDLGVDFRQCGLLQLTEALELLQNFNVRSAGRLKIVINHLCKPDLRSDGAGEDHKGRKDWEHAIKALADLPTTYMKLSGLFSELPPQTSDNPMPISELVERTKFEMDVTFDNFGPENIMFGSDWPVCNVGGPGTEKSWAHWVDFVAAVLDERALSDYEKARVWAGTANEVYDLQVDLSGSEDDVEDV